MNQVEPSISKIGGYQELCDTVRQATIFRKIEFDLKSQLKMQAKTIEIFEDRVTTKSNRISLRNFTYFVNFFGFNTWNQFKESDPKIVLFWKSIAPSEQKKLQESVTHIGELSFYIEKRDSLFSQFPRFSLSFSIIIRTAVRTRKVVFCFEKRLSIDDEF